MSAWLLQCWGNAVHRDSSETTVFHAMEGPKISDATHLGWRQGGCLLCSFYWNHTCRRRGRYWASLGLSRPVLLGYLLLFSFLLWGKASPQWKEVDRKCGGDMVGSLPCSGWLAATVSWHFSPCCFLCKQTCLLRGVGNQCLTAKDRKEFGGEDPPARPPGNPGDSDASGHVGDACTLLKSTFLWPSRNAPGTTSTRRRTTWDLHQILAISTRKIPLKVSGAEVLEGGGCHDMHPTAGFGQEPLSIASLWTALVALGLLQAGPTTASTLLPGPASPPDWDHKHLPLLEAALLHGVMFHCSDWLLLRQQKVQSLKPGFGHRAQWCLMQENAEADADKDSPCSRRGAEEGNSSPPAPEPSSQPASFRVKDVGPRAGGCSFGSEDGPVRWAGGRARTEP